MRVLIVTKPSNMEQHGEMVRLQIEKGFVPPSYLEVLEHSHHQHYQSLKLLEERLVLERVQYVVMTRDHPVPNISDFDAIFAIGGDGTLLAAGHHVLCEEVPLIGIRSSQTSVGHLCAGDQAAIPELVSTLLRGKLQVIRCERLQAKIFRLESNETHLSIPCLNDILYTNVHPAATTRYHMVLKQRTEMQKSSGVWVATAVGSSAGISAAGGMAMDMTDRRFQFRVREPFSHPMSPIRFKKGFFCPEDAPFAIINQNDTAILALDGARLQLTVKLGDRIVFMRGNPVLLAIDPARMPAVVDKGGGGRC